MEDGDIGHRKGGTQKFLAIEIHSLFRKQSQNIIRETQHNVSLIRESIMGRLIGSSSITSPSYGVK
jgi:hypothetical protein